MGGVGGVVVDGSGVLEVEIAALYMYDALFHNFNVLLFHHMLFALMRHLLHG